VKLADEFVGMYVNKWTLDYGPVGRQAVNKLLDEGAGIGMVPKCTPVEFVG
jgi:1,4-dihydroxy-6-naphthoate synthase